MPSDFSEVLQRARIKRQSWEQVWRECCTYAQPHRNIGSAASGFPSMSGVEKIFDSTAVDAVEQLSASLVAELLPPWSTWFSLRPGSSVPPEEHGRISEALDSVTQCIQGHFDRSNFGVELHQTFLDLVTLGTASLQFEESPIGETSAFRFSAVPAHEIYLDGDHTGRITRHIRLSTVSIEYLTSNFPTAIAQSTIPSSRPSGSSSRYDLVEMVSTISNGRFHYTAFIPSGQLDNGEPIELTEAIFDSPPLITFRWAKGAGDLYGRSPVMSALPDIKTANKVVELILRNASIAATGIWLAEDDGVLNPANIKLTPGTIIPKAVGSAGLTPLQAPGRFDVSQLVLDDLRAQIRHTMLIDKFTPVATGRMTATEVMERSAEASRILGAVFGRLQAELVRPLISRAIKILSRRGEIPHILLDGIATDLEYRSPLSRAQARQDVKNTLLWLDAVSGLGAGAKSVVNDKAIAIALARSLGVDPKMIQES